MKKFVLTSTLFEGECTFVFSDTGMLVLLDLTNAELSDQFISAMLANIPRLAQDITKIKGRTGVITEVCETVTFDIFWKRYDDKANSSRKKTEAKWNKMPYSEQIKAYQHIKKYFNSIPSGIRKKYAETYLNAELWNN